MQGDRLTEKQLTPRKSVDLRVTRQADAAILREALILLVTTKKLELDTELRAITLYGRLMTSNERT